MLKNISILIFYVQREFYRIKIKISNIEIDHIFNIKTTDA